MRLNKQQRVVIYLGGVVLLGMLVYPPWVSISSHTHTPRQFFGGGSGGRFFGRARRQQPTTYTTARTRYDWLFRAGGDQIDTGRLLLQIVAVAVVAGVAIVALQQESTRERARRVVSGAHHAAARVGQAVGELGQGVGECFEASVIQPLRCVWRRRALLLLCAGGILVGAMLLHPPWRFTYTALAEDLDSEIERILAIGVTDRLGGKAGRVHSWLWETPAEVQYDGLWWQVSDVAIDLPTLLVQCAGAVVLASALALACDWGNRRAVLPGKGQCMTLAVGTLVVLGMLSWSPWVDSSQCPKGDHTAVKVDDPSGLAEAMAAIDCLRRRDAEERGDNVIPALGSTDREHLRHSALWSPPTRVWTDGFLSWVETQTAKLDQSQTEQKEAADAVAACREEFERDQGSLLREKQPVLDRLEEEHKALQKQLAAQVISRVKELEKARDEAVREDREVIRRLDQLLRGSRQNVPELAKRRMAIAKRVSACEEEYGRRIDTVRREDAPELRKLEAERAKLAATGSAQLRELEQKRDAVLMAKLPTMRALAARIAAAEDWLNGEREFRSSPVSLPVLYQREQGRDPVALYYGPWSPAASRIVPASHNPEWRLDRAALHQRCLLGAAVTVVAFAGLYLWRRAEGAGAAPQDEETENPTG